MKRSTSRSLAARAKQTRTEGFTRLELLAVVIFVGMLSVVVLPLVGQGKPRGQQAVCLNNLRLIGQAILAFDIEHGQTDPWRLPDAESPAPSLKNNAWYHFWLLTNEIKTPMILACPSDSKTRQAKDFSVSSDGGFLNPNYRNSCISYFLGLDSFYTLPNSILAGDRNIQLAGCGPCSSGINPAGTIYTFGQNLTAWLNGIHGTSGNILFHDGRVEELATLGLNGAFRSPADDNGSTHLLLPSPFFP